jgi:hypothetical protein
MHGRIYNPSGAPVNRPREMKRRDKVEAAGGKNGTKLRDDVELLDRDGIRSIKEVDCFIITTLASAYCTKPPSS